MLTATPVLLVLQHILKLAAWLWEDPRLARQCGCTRASPFQHKTLSSPYSPTVPYSALQAVAIDSAEFLPIRSRGVSFGGRGSRDSLGSFGSLAKGHITVSPTPSRRLRSSDGRRGLGSRPWISAPF